MPELHFQIKDVTAAERGMTPLLNFALVITNQTPGEAIAAITLHAQIQIQCPQRTYNAAEKERLSELFGEPERWGATLRNRLWAHVNATAPSFTGETEITLPVPCTYDLQVSSAKYFHALQDGEVPLLFLFSGTVFYLNDAGLLQVQQIPWSSECAYRMPLQQWRALMESHYPNQFWIQVSRSTFEQFYNYKRRHGLTSWDQTLEQLLPVELSEEVAV